MTQTRPPSSAGRSSSTRRSTGRSRVFTERFGDFKPPEHNLLGAPIAETVFEPRVGGHIYDRGDGRQRVPLGPDPRLRPAAPRGVQLGHQPDLADRDRPRATSEVEVRFVAEGPDRTRVELEHRHLDRHGPGWEAIADGVDGDQRLAAVPRPLRGAVGHGTDPRPPASPRPGHLPAAACHGAGRRPARRRTPGGDHGGDHEGGEERGVDDSGVEGHAGQHDAWTAAGVGSDGEVDDVQPAEAGAPRGEPHRGEPRQGRSHQEGPQQDQREALGEVEAVPDDREVDRATKAAAETWVSTPAAPGTAGTGCSSSPPTIPKPARNAANASVTSRAAARLT